MSSEPHLIPNWREHAKCRGMDTSLFFPERGDDVGAAKAVCKGCWVKRECLLYALTRLHVDAGGNVRRGEDQGIWGGTSARERRKMRKGR